MGRLSKQTKKERESSYRAKKVRTIRSPASQRTRYETEKGRKDGKSFYDWIEKKEDQRKKASCAALNPAKSRIKQGVRPDGKDHDLPVPGKTGNTQRLTNPGFSTKKSATQGKRKRPCTRPPPRAPQKEKTKGRPRHHASQ